MRRVKGACPPGASDNVALVAALPDDSVADPHRGDSRRPWRVVTTAVIVATGLGAVALIGSAMPPGGTLVLLFTGLTVLLICGIVWVAVALWGWLSHRAWKLSLIAPLLGATAIGLVALSVPTRVGFLIDQPRYAAMVANGCRVDQSAAQPVFATVMSAEEVDLGATQGSACRLSLASGALNDEALVYAPAGRPPLLDPEVDLGVRDVTHLDGPWYHVSYSW